MTALLVNRPPLYPDESMTSYLERLIRANHYDPPGLLKTWLRSGGEVRDFNTLRTLGVFQRLSSATGYSVHRLYQTTIHCLAPLLLPPEASPDWLRVDSYPALALFPSRHPKPMRSATSTVYCPGCLQEGLYHRLLWQCSAIAACPRHACWLLDRCPGCGTPVTTLAVVSARCPTCQQDLREAHSRPLLEQDLVYQTQRCLSDWCGGQATPPDRALPTASIPVLFRLLDGLRIAAQWLGNSWSFLHDAPFTEPFPMHMRRPLSLQQTNCLYATAFKGLLDWPDGFFAFLDAYRLHTGGHGLQSLNVLYITWLEQYWQQPAFAFVQDAFNRYLTTHFPPTRSVLQSIRLKKHPELVNQFVYVDVRNAARLLKTSPPKIKRLVRDQILAIYPEDDPGRPGIFLFREQLKTWQPDSVPAKYHLATILGVSLETLNKLVARGLLKMTGQQHNHDQIRPVLSLLDVERFHQQLSTHVTQQAFPPHGALTLNEASVLNGKVGWGMVDLFERLLSGNLTAFHPHPHLKPLTALWFEAEAIFALTQQVKDENGWLGFLETAALLQVGRRVLHHWIDSGLLVPVASFARAQYFLTVEVLKFRQRRVTTPEAVILLETNRSAISYWVQAGYLQVLSGPGTNNHSEYVFDRHYLHHWHTQYVTTPDAKHLLKATDHALRLWREEGKLIRLTDDLRKPTFYARAQVLHLQQNLMQPPPAH